MEDAYVKYETAQLLKEKGFDWGCCSYWCVFPNGDIVHTEYVHFANHNGNETDRFVSRPTQAMACRWLREEHKMFISIGVGTDIDDVFGYMPEIYFLEELDSDVGMYGPNVDSETICDFTPQSPEDAIEAALKFALTNLI